MNINQVNIKHFHLHYNLISAQRQNLWVFGHSKINYVGKAQYYWANLLFCKSFGLNILSDSEFMTKAC